MAQTKSQSTLFQKLGPKLEQAINAHKNDDTILANRNVPGGIKNGIAQLVKCGFGEYGPDTKTPGMPYFRAEGVIVSPKKLGEIPIAGKPTSIMESLFETPDKKRKTVDQHIQFVMDTMRSLGLVTKTLTVHNIEAQAKALETVKPYFRFETWQGEKATTGPFKDKEPMVQHFWYESIPGYIPESPHDAGNGYVKDTSPQGKPKAVPTGGPAQAKTPEESEKPPFDEFQNDLPGLLASANDQDATAQKKLVELAIAAGYSKEQAEDGNTSWEQVVEMINTPVGQGEGQEEPEAEEEGEGSWSPSVNQTCHFTPTNKRTGKKTVPVECQVLEVNVEAQTLTLKNLEDAKTVYRDVKWAEIQGQ